MRISVCLINLLAKINVFKTDNMNYNKGDLVSLEDTLMIALAWVANAAHDDCVLEESVLLGKKLWMQQWLAMSLAKILD